MPETSFRPLLPADLPAVSALGIASKQSWGYDAAQMAIFARELTLTPEVLAGLLAAEVACENGTIVGYYTIRRHATNWSTCSSPRTGFVRALANCCCIKPGRPPRPGGMPA
ncbi:MAG TPA: hypothetical protein VL527_00650 [Dongiaceae bacterium]|nr:hypothetical protein [Dongiaceae bacterium]